jgi:hypothetical protein
MKFTGFEKVDPTVRSIILISVAIAYPEAIKMKQLGPRLAAGALIVCLILAGFIAGRNHFYFLICEDSEITGNYVPENCATSRTRECHSVSCQLRLDQKDC